MSNAKFKVEVIKDKTGKVWTSNADEHKAGVGAIALGDTLATATYKLYKQYTKEYVVAKDNEFKLAKGLRKFPKLFQQSRWIFQKSCGMLLC